MKFNCGLEHGQPAQRAMSKVIFDGLLWVLDPSWFQSKGGPKCEAHVPVRGARARLVQELYQHNWDPTFDRFQLKLERTGFSKPKRKQRNKDITFSCTSLNQECQQGWGGLGFHLIAG